MKSLELALLQENPDVVTNERGDQITNVFRNQAYPFGIWKGKLYLGDLHDTHQEIIYMEARRKQRSQNGIAQEADIVRELQAEGFPRYRMEWTYPGRIWKDLKIISFWESPSRAEFFQILDELDKLPLVRTRDGEWKVDAWRMDIEDIGLIPVEEYRISEEEPKPAPPISAADHVRPPMEKPVRPVPDGIGSKKSRGILPVKANFYRNLSEAFLGEVADEIYPDDEGVKNVGTNRLFFEDEDAHAFFLLDGKMHVSKPTTTHGELAYEITGEWYPDIDERYRGRIWRDRKVISFWEYPETQHKLKEIIWKLEKATGILSIWDNGWWLETSSTWSENSTLIPLESYLEKTEEDPEYHEHEKSPLDKKKKVVPPGIGSKKNLGPLPVKTNFYRNLSEAFLDEIADEFSLSPEFVKQGGRDYFLYRDQDARAFYFTDGVIRVSRFGATHNELSDETVGEPDSTLEEMDYAGRIWVDSKIMSFWEYPETQFKLKEIVWRLEEATRLSIWNNGWSIEIPDRDRDNPSTLVPLEDYKEKTQDNPEYHEHGKGPIEKQKKRVPTGVGSKKNLGPLPVKTNFYRNLSEALLVEEPDQIDLEPEEAKKIGKQGKTRLFFRDGEAHAFLYDPETDELILSEPGGRHGWMKSKEGRGVGFDGTKRGRVWLNSKVISFWNYPETQSDLRKIIRDLEKNLRTRIWNSGWWIEQRLPEMHQGNRYQHASTLAPLEDFAGRTGLDPEYREHERSPFEKPEREVPSGMGSKKYRGSLPAKTNYDYSANIAESIIVETPDSFTDPIDGSLIAYDTGDSYPFVYALPYATMLVGKRQQSHFYVWKALENGYNSGKYDFDRDDLDKDDIVDGRIWTDRKVISFWYTPEEAEDFEEVIEALEHELRIKTFNNDYRLDLGWNNAKRHNDMVPLDKFRSPRRNKSEELPPDRLIWAPPPKSKVKGKMPPEAKERSLRDLYR